MNIGSLMDEVITSDYRHPRDSSGMYPSSATIKVGDEVKGCCARELFYKSEDAQLDEPVGTVSTEAYYIFKRGNQVEDMVMGLLKPSGMLIGSNIKWNGFAEGNEKAVYLSGEIDGLLQDPVEEGVAWILEVKSYTNNYYSAKSLRDNGAFHNDKYLLQCMIYLDMFKRRSKYKIAGCKLLYLDSNKPGPAGRHEFLLQLDDEGNLITEAGVHPDWNVKSIYDRMGEVDEKINLEELPDRDFVPEYSEDEIHTMFDQGVISKTKYNDWAKGKTDRIGYWKCQYCPYLEACLQDKKLSELKEDEEEEY